MKSEKLDWGLRSSKLPTEWRTWAQFLMLLHHQHKLSRVSWPGYCGGDTHRHHRRFCLAVTWAFSTDLYLWEPKHHRNFDRHCLSSRRFSARHCHNMGPQPLTLYLGCLHSISWESEKWLTFIHLHNHKRIMSISIFSIRYNLIILPV